MTVSLPANGLLLSANLSDIKQALIAYHDNRWLASGLYTDRLSKCSSGCWRFNSRTFIADGLSTAITTALPTTAKVVPRL
jgi:hypothetical protein